MKLRLFVALLALIGGGNLAAQGDLRQEIKRLDLTEAQMNQVVQVIRDTQPDLEKYRAEAKVTQARLARLLLEDNPSRADIEKMVKETQDWDTKAKLLRIDRSLKLRTIIGKDRWAGLSSLSARALEAEKSGKRPLPWKADDKPPLKDLLKLLKDLN